MKRSLFLFTVAASLATAAAPIRFGADVAAGYNILFVGDNLDKDGTESKASLGFVVGPTVSYSINEQFAIGGRLSVLYDIDRTSNSNGISKSDDNFQLLGAGLQIAPSYQINKQIGVKLGYEWDIPITGTADMQGTSQDIVWAPGKIADMKEGEVGLVSTHNLIVGGSYAFLPNLELTIQGKFALTGVFPKYKQDGNLDGAESNTNNINVHQVAIGVHYLFE